MMNVKFNIAATRTNFFTPAQAKKVDAGIEIFKKVVTSQNFRDAVCKFNWRTTEGMTYNRFFMSNGMSNEQVWDMICNEFTWTEKLNNVVSGMMWGGATTNNCAVVNVMPCCTRQEVVNCCNDVNNPSICIDTNVLNNTWYTPVHVACAMMHEWCCMNGFVPTGITSGIENRSMNSVPLACAWIVKGVCEAVCNTQEVTDWCNTINNNTFTYSPCATTYNCWTNTTNCTSTVSMMDQCMNMMAQEMAWLQTCENSTPDVVNRMSVLTNCMNAMNDMKVNMCNTSLDGCDVVCMPAVEMSTVSAN